MPPEALGAPDREDPSAGTPIGRVPRRWAISIVVFLSFALTIGIAQYSYGVFITDLEGEFGWTRTQLSAAFSFFALAGLAALPVGWALDRFGARPVMFASISMLAFSQLARVGMGEIWHLYVLTAIQFAALPGAATITGPRLVGQWFEHSRGRAMGFTAMGANAGGIIFSSLTAVLVGAVGWRASYAFYGLLFALLLPAILFVVREPKRRREEAEEPAVPSDGAVEATPRPPKATPAYLLGLTLRQALRSRSFYLVAFAIVLAQSTYQSVLPQIVPHLQNVGVSRTTAATMLSAAALFGGIGKVSFGWVCERYPARFALVGSLLLQVGGLLILVTVEHDVLRWLFVPVFGSGFGALGVIMPLLVQETFGLRAFATIFGFVNFLTLSSALVGPLLVGASFDATGSYQLAFLVLSGLFTLAAVTVWFAHPPWSASASRPVETPPPATAGRV